MITQIRSPKILGVTFLGGRDGEKTPGWWGAERSPRARKISQNFKNRSNYWLVGLCGGGAILGKKENVQEDGAGVVLGDWLGRGDRAPGTRGYGRGLTRGPPRLPVPVGVGVGLGQRCRRGGGRGGGC